MTQLLWQNCIAGFQSNFQPWLHDTLGKGKEKHFSQSGLSLSLSLSPRLFWRWSILSLRAEPKPLWWGCQLCINNRMFTAQALHVSSLVPERQKSHVHSREHSLDFRHVWNHRGWVRVHFKTMNNAKRACKSETTAAMKTLTVHWFTPCLHYINVLFNQKHGHK